MKRILLKTTVPIQLKEYIIELNNGSDNLIKATSKHFVIIKNQKNIRETIINNISESSFLKRYIEKIMFLDNDIENIDEILTFLDDSTYKLDVYPKKNEIKYIKYFYENNINLNPTKFEKFLYIYDYDGEISFGISKERMNETLIFNEKHISRAYFKISEIIERLDYNQKLNNVLDIGAAPGGWSEYFITISKKVIAVDSAEMKVKGKNLIHIKGKFEDNYDEIEKYAPFDLIAYDMNQNPEEVSNYLNYFSKYLKENGILIYTLKLIYKREFKKKQLIIESQKLLTNFKNKKIYWLLSNRKHERTLVAYK